jgi:hypothetical protein
LSGDFGGKKGEGGNVGATCIQFALFYKTGVKDDAEMLGGGEDEDEYISAQASKKSSTAGVTAAEKMPVAPNMDEMTEEGQKSALAEYRKEQKQWTDRRLKERNRKRLTQQST